MSGALFDMDADPSPRDDLGPAPARDEQITAIRLGLDEAGIVSQEDRQALVESVILTKARSLRDLTAVQARRVIDHLKVARTRPTVSGGSAWDNREEDTWIDRL